MAEFVRFFRIPLACSLIRCRHTAIGADAPPSVRTPSEHGTKCLPNGIQAFAVFAHLSAEGRHAKEIWNLVLSSHWISGTQRS
jgi:hypothetical protein